MQHTATWNFAPADTNRLRELLNPAGSNRLSVLLKLYACADVVAPVDDVAFGRRAGELIYQLAWRGGFYPRKAETDTPTAGKYRLRALQCHEVAAQTRDTYAKDMLTVVAREFLQAAHEAENPEVEKGKPPGDEPSG